MRAVLILGGCCGYRSFSYLKVGCHFGDCTAECLRAVTTSMEPLDLSLRSRRRSSHAFSRSTGRQASLRVRDGLS